MHQSPIQIFKKKEIMNNPRVRSMKKRGQTLRNIVLGFALLVLLIIVATMWIKQGPVTGRATTASHTINVSISNTAPAIKFVTVVDAHTPIEDTIVNVSVNFTAHDGDGVANLEDASALVNFSRSGEPLRQNSSCNKAGANNNGTSVNYTCTVQMWYFDQTGAWTINTVINDTSSQSNNATSTFFYNTLTAFKSSPGALTFPSLSPGGTNTTSNNDPILINNTGNVAISGTGIDLNATNLVGETDSATAIYAGNFSVGIATGSAVECGGVNTTTLSRAVYSTLTNATLGRGNYSVNDGSTGQEQLYLCIKLVGSELSQQAYSTSNQGAWTLRIS